MTQAEAAPAPTCARHGTPTRLSCSRCGTPICPRCAVDAAVGHACPTCVRERNAPHRARERRLIVRAVVGGVAAAVLGGVVYGLLVRAAAGLFSLLLAYVLGALVARGVVVAAREHRGADVRRLAVAAAVLAVAVGLVLRTGSPLVVDLRMLAYLAAGYGAWRSV